MLEEIHDITRYFSSGSLGIGAGLVTANVLSDSDNVAPLSQAREGKADNQPEASSGGEQD